MKHLLTIEDLVEFCKNQNFQHFNSKESGYQICVQIPAVFKKEETEDNTLFYGNVLVMHTGRNLNGSWLTEDAAQKAIKTLAYKPVLANFCEIDGVRDFTDHDFEIDEANDSIIYYEKQIGCFTADDPYMLDDEKVKGRKNIYAKVAIPREYTDAADIIERKGGTNCSVEMSVLDLSWNAKESVLMLNDVVIMGLCCLGKHPENGKDVLPGMQGAHIQIEDFSISNNSAFFNKSELVDEITQAVMSRLDNHIAESSANYNQGKEDKQVKKNEDKLVIEPDVNDSPESLVTFDDDPGENPSEDPSNPSEDPEDPSEDEENTTDADAASAVDDLINALNDESTESEIDAARDAYDELTSEQQSLVTTLDKLTSQETRIADSKDDGVMNNGQSAKKGFSKVFEISHDDIRCGLYALLAPYEEADNEWYWISKVFDNHFVYEGMLNPDNIFDQEYSVVDDVISFSGERTHLHSVLVTDSEYAQLNEMRSNYSAISEKLAKYEAEPEKMNILNSADYRTIAEEHDFAELKKQENHFDMSIDELKNKADSMLLQYAKAGKLNFSADEVTNEETPKKDFFAFARVSHDSSFLDGLLKK